MKFNQILKHNLKNNSFDLDIIKHCSTFLRESEGKPLFKVLDYDEPAKKVKIRFKKRNDEYALARETAFRYRNFDERVLETLTTKPLIGKAFYVFPINGYKFIYNTSSDANLVESCKIVGERLGVDGVSEVLQYTYKNENLIGGLTNAKKVLFYNIPFYYIVEASISYKKLYERLI